jgi:tRNA (guanine37-N1)-methyltransferase
MRIDIVTPFPLMFDGFMGESIIRRALENGLAEIKTWDLRSFTEDKHQTVDDYPYGGGPGMIMKPEPIFRAVEQILNESSYANPRIICLTPQGERYDQRMARELAGEDQLIFICGHYRGIDQRVIDYIVTDEISIGDYILTGGELAAGVIVDSVIRLIPGVLGDADSAEGDSFSKDRLDHPHFTRPAVFRGLEVPEVLLSGHHARVDSWREEQSMSRTVEKRPDLLGKKLKKDRKDKDK